MCAENMRYHEDKCYVNSPIIISMMKAVVILQGTLIRVFDVLTKKLVVELRRGADPAMLYRSVAT